MDQKDCAAIGPSIKGTPSGGLYKKQPNRTLGQKTALTLRARNWRRNPQRIPKPVLQMWPMTTTMSPLKSLLKWETIKLHHHSLLIKSLGKRTLGFRRKHTFLTTSPQTLKKQNRGPKLTEDRNCLHRNKTCQKERCTNLSECPIVAYRRDKPLKDLLVRARTPTLKKLTNSSFSRHTNILFQSLLRKTITALI